MSGLLTDLKENHIVVKTKLENYKISILKTLLLLFVFNGLATILSYLLLGVFGNSMMILIAFVSPILLFYIYTLSDEIINPLIIRHLVSIESDISRDFCIKTTNSEEVKPKTEEVNETTVQ